MSRSLLDQLTQIRASGAYDDVVGDVYTSAVAEPATMSGSLQGDLNIVRTLVKNLKGTINWFGNLGNYFDPTNTDASDVDNKALTIANIGGNTIDSKTVIIAVSADNSGANYTVSGTSTGVLISATTIYATPTDRRGLPIFLSTTNSGSYYDEAGSDNVCRIDVLNTVNDVEFNDGTHIIYAKFHDGADFDGTGTGTDVYVRFYKNGATCDLTGTGVTSIKFIYPQRRVMSAMEEYDWLRTDFVNSWEGDVELVEDISNLWSYTGSGDNIDDASGWTDTIAHYVLQADPTSLWTAIDILNTEIGDRDYFEQNYIISGEDIADSLDKLDQELKDVADSIVSASEKYIEETVGNIPKNTVHPLPYSLTYTPYSVTGREGRYMDVYVEGQLLAADTGANGANADRDYGETTTSGITFRFNVKSHSNIIYVVRV
jgi:hypothetical protein